MNKFLFSFFIAAFLLVSVSVSPSRGQETDDSSLFLTAFSAYQAKDYAGAVKLVEYLLEKYPTTPLRDLTLVLLSRSHQKLNNKDATAKAASRFLQEYPKSYLKESIGAEALVLAQKYSQQKSAQGENSFGVSASRATTSKAEEISKEKERLTVAKVEKERTAKVKAEAERIAKEKAEQQRLALLKAEEERQAKEKAEAERIAKEKAEQQRLALLKAEEERQAKEKAEAERLAKEKAEQQRLALLKAEEERQAKEKAEAERLAKEKAEQQRLALLKAEKERQAKEKAEAERLAKEKAELQRLALLKADEERQAKEKAEAERIAGEQAEQQRLALLKAEEERQAKEKAEAERIAREQAEQQRLALLKAEEERQAKEKAEADRFAKEKAEQQRLALAKDEEERVAREKIEAERKAKEKVEKDRLSKLHAEVASGTATPSPVVVMEQEHIAPVGRETKIPISIRGVTGGATVLWNSPAAMSIRLVEPLKITSGTATGTLGVTLPVAIDGSRFRVRLLVETADHQQIPHTFTVVASSPLLRAVAKAGKKLALPGETVEFRVTVLNAGTLAAEDANLQVKLSSFVEIVDPGPFVVQSRDVLVMPSLKIPSGDSHELVIRLRVSTLAQKGQEIRVRGSLSGGGSDRVQQFASPPVVVRLAD